jgi:hypothetical protein
LVEQDMSEAALNVDLGTALSTIRNQPKGMLKTVAVDTSRLSLNLQYFGA